MRRVVVSATAVGLATGVAYDAAVCLAEQLGERPNWPWEAAQKFGAYAVAAKVSAETLWRWGVEQHLVPDAKWNDEPFHVRAFYLVFADTAFMVAELLRYQHALAGKTPPHPSQPLKLEDSIFEDEEPMGTLTDQAKLAAAQRLPAAREELGTLPDPSSGAEGDERNVLAIGEAPARPPTNRGGRGRTKNR
ncbi:MAG: hypothetical protein ACXWKQ_07380 [Reyranella sp.]